MHWLYTILFVGAIIPTACASGERAREVVETAIRAQGGAEQVAKLRVMRIKAEGTMQLIPGQPAVSFVIEDWWQMPDQYKSTSSFQLNGKKVSQTQTINGGAGWMQMNGITRDMPDDALSEMRKQKYAEDFDRLGFLGDEEKELKVLDDVQVGGRDAVGVLVTSKGHRDVKLYFDKEKGLLIKRAHQLLDPQTGKVVLQEVVFGDYRETAGVKHYHTLTGYRDGKRLMQVKVVEIECFDRLDESVFKKP